MSIYKEGQLVWAQLRGYNWWPAKVMESNEKKNGQIANEVRVEFIGEGKFADISISKLVDFQEKYSQHSDTKNQKLIDVLKTIPEASFFQFSEGHKNGSLNLTWNSILLEPKTDESEEENHFCQSVKNSSINQGLEPKNSKNSSSLDKDHETKSLNSKRTIEELENKQESIAAKSLMRCSYEDIPDFIQAQESMDLSGHGVFEAMVRSPFYSINLQDFMRYGNNNGDYFDEEDFEDSESNDEREEKEDYEVIEKKLKMESKAAAKNKNTRTSSRNNVPMQKIQKPKKVFNTRNNGKMGKAGLYTEEYTSSESSSEESAVNYKSKQQKQRTRNQRHPIETHNINTAVTKHKEIEKEVPGNRNQKVHIETLINTAVIKPKEIEKEVPAPVAVAVPAKKAKKVAKEPEVKVENKELETRNKCSGLIEGLVNKLLGMYEENKTQLNDEILRRRLNKEAKDNCVQQEFAVLIEEPDDAYTNNIIMETENFDDRYKKISERMKELLDQVIVWLTENLEKVDKEKLMNQISIVVEQAVQGSKLFFLQLKNFFIITYEFLLKNKQLTNIMDNNILSSIIDLVHELDTETYDQPAEVAVPNILTPTNRHPAELHEKEPGKCESVNHVERSTRKASGTSSESHSNTVEHMTEKEQQEEQNLEPEEEEEEIEEEEEEEQQELIEHEEVIVEISEEDMMKNILLRRNVCQKFAKLFQKLYKLKMDTVQDLVVLVEGRIQSLCFGNVDSYKKSIRILYKLTKMKVIKLEEIQAIPYMEFGNFRGMLENKISQEPPGAMSESNGEPKLNPDFSFDTEVVLNIKPGYSSLVIDDDFYSNHSHENNIQDVIS